MVRRYRFVVDIVNQNLEHRQDVVKMDALQNLDEQNLDEVLTYQDVVHQFLAAVQVDVELRSLLNQKLRKDCYLDEEGAVPHFLSRKDYFLDEVLALAHLLQVHSLQIPLLLGMVQVLLQLLLLPREML